MSRELESTKYEPDGLEPDPEWVRQMDEAYAAFAALHRAYEEVIRLEGCPVRRERLLMMLDDVREENK